MENVKKEGENIPRKMMSDFESYTYGEDFSIYVERLEQHFVLNDVTEAKKVPFLLTHIGMQAYEVLKRLLSPTKPTGKTYEQLVAELKAYFKPEVNEIPERYKFFLESQKSGQSIKEYVVDLRRIASNCNFGTFLESALRDRLVFGLRDSKLRTQLLKDSALTFQKAYSTAISWELAEKDTAENTSSIKKFSGRNVARTRGRSFQRSKSQNRQANNPSGSKCNRCGQSHNQKECPAKDWMCYKCNIRGHIAKMCKTANPQQRHPNKQQNSNISSVTDIVDEIASLNFEFKTISQTSEIQTSKSEVYDVYIEDQIIPMEVDTGACTSVIGIDEYNKYFSKFQISKITNTKNFRSVSGEIIRVYGKILVNVSLNKNGPKYPLELIVIKCNGPVFPLMGRTWLDVLVPDWRNILTHSISRILSVKNDSILDQITRNFPNIVSQDPNNFILNYEAEIVLKNETKPIFHAAYTAPLQLRPEIEKELENMCNSGILERVKYSEWASPIVVVPKPKGGIRICIDCKVTINQYIRLDHYPLPRADDIFASLANCNIFCVIDLSGAYLQLKVSDSSKQLLTINTHKGLFRYNRLIYGVASAPAIFQSVMDQILVNIPGVAVYLDDILIGGKNYNECRERLLEVFDRLNSHKVVINKAKCKLFEECVDFLGHTISKEGIRPNGDKLVALKDAPVPKNLVELQAYLGLLNYYNRFIPNISSKLKSLYELLRKDEIFEMTPHRIKCFKESQEFLTEFGILELFDPSKPIIVAADASPYGVGAVLSHLVDGIEKPVLFVSSTLSPAEKNYSQLHKEALAIVFALKRFHKYIYGHTFTLCSDCQALKEIFHPHKSTSSVAASRLQRWAVILSMYSYNWEYRPASKMVTADAMSRLPMNLPTNIPEYSVNSLEIFKEIPIKYEEIASELQNDPLLKLVATYLVNGWPKKVSPNLVDFFKIRENLCLDLNCLFFRDRVIIPEKLKLKVLKLLHSNHDGIVRTKMLARSIFWWKGMAKDIESLVKNCVICDQTRRVPKEVIKTSWPETTYPFQRIHIDFFKFDGLVFLLIVDTFSKFIDTKPMPSGTNVYQVIEVLQSYFKYFGICEEIVSDNGPPFNSYIFEEFGRLNGIKISKSPPYHPQSNGQAEKSVDILKTHLNKFLLDQKVSRNKINWKLNMLLMCYNSTPSTVTLKSPYNIIFSYKPKTILECKDSKKIILNFENTDKKQVIFNLDKNNVQIYDKNIPIVNQRKPNEHQNLTNDRKSLVQKFKKGEKVLYRNHFKDIVKWIPCTIFEQISLTLYKINLNGNIRIVHANQLRYPSNNKNCDHLLTKIPKEFTLRKNKRSLEPDLITVRRSVRRKKEPSRFKYNENFKFVP